MHGQRIGSEGRCRRADDSSSQGVLNVGLHRLSLQLGEIAEAAAGEKCTGLHVKGAIIWAVWRQRKSLLFT